MSFKNFPVDNFEVVSVSFLSGATLYLRELSAPQRKLWKRILDVVFGEDRKDLSLAEYQASLITASLIAFETSSKTKPDPSIIFTADSRDRLFMSSQPVDPGKLEFAGYLIDDSTLNDEIVDLFEMIVDQWSTDRLEQTARQLERLNRMEDTSLVRDEHESNEEYEERIAAKNSQQTPTSSTG